MTCPKCKNPISDVSKECEWCGNENITESVAKASEEVNNVPNLDFQLLELCRNGNKLDAVKLKKDNSSMKIIES